MASKYSIVYSTLYSKINSQNKKVFNYFLTDVANAKDKLRKTVAFTQGFVMRFYMRFLCFFTFVSYAFSKAFLLFFSVTFVFTKSFVMHFHVMGFHKRL